MNAAVNAASPPPSDRPADAAAPASDAPGGVPGVVPGEAVAQNATQDAPAPLEQLADWLESLAADHSRLDALPADLRARLHQSVARLYHPDPTARRQRLKAAERERAAARVRRLRKRLARRPVQFRPGGLGTAARAHAIAGKCRTGTRHRFAARHADRAAAAPPPGRVVAAGRPRR